MKFSISFKYSNVTFKNKETKETVTYDSKAEGNTFTFDNVDEDVVIGMVKGIKDRKASQVFAYDNFRTNFINTLARNKCKELYDKLDKNEWKIEDIAISNITIKDIEFTKPTMNAREAITVESRKRISESIYDNNLDEALNLMNEAAASLHMAMFDIKNELGEKHELSKRVESNYNDVHETYDIMEEFMDKESSERIDESYDDEYDDEDVGDGQWHVFDYGPDFPLIEQYMIMSPTGDTWPATSRGEICDYDGEYHYSTRQEMEDDVFALDIDGEEWIPTEIDQPYPREVQKAIGLVISRLDEDGITVDEP